MTYQQLKTDLRSGDIQLKFPYKPRKADKDKLIVLINEAFPEDVTRLFGHRDEEGYKQTTLYITGYPYGVWEGWWRVATKPFPNVPIVEYTSELF